MKRIVFLVVSVLIFNINLSAMTSETLPTHHWIYVLISEFQARGYFLELSQMNMPYTRGDVANAILNNKNKIKDLNLYQGWINELESEFKNEITEINFKSQETKNTLVFRTKVNANLDNNSKETKYKGIYRGGVGINFTENIFAFSGVNFNQYDLDDPEYAGYEWRGITGYTEQAYISFQNKRFLLKLGRDYLRWGTGKNGTLVMSNIARPLDQIYGDAKVGPFKFSFFTSELDQYGSIYTEDAIIPVRRFLSGHRLDLVLFNGKLQASVSELMLYGGQDKTFDVVYSNPFIFWHGANYNNKSNSGNVLPTVDVLYYPVSNWKLYGSLLIDDIQVEKTGPGDLEPNEIGFIGGTEYAEPMGISGMTVNAEYTRVANRTYKTPNPLETFIHRNVPLGHPLGNDFEQLNLGVKYWVNSFFKTEIDYFYTKNGEGSIYTTWDDPWMDFTVDEGYDEPFPFGTVEKENSIRFKAMLNYKYWARLNLELLSSSIKNKANVSGDNDTMFQWILSVELNYDHFFSFN